MYKRIIRPFLFLINPESAHHLVFNTLKIIFAIPFLKGIIKSFYSCPSRPIRLFGIDFPNRTGLAAGLDKDAKYFEELSVFGFGFIEIGTLTPKAQPGNPRPRMFRLPADEGLINSMGFNNEGVEAAVRRLRKNKSKIIIGGNIGRNKLTENDNALSDYENCFESLFDYVDYFAVNVSSPNTPGLRELQEKEPLTKLLHHLMMLNRNRKAPRPVLLKIAPDLSNSQLDEIIEIVNETGISGIIATNTTISRDQLTTPLDEVQAMGTGGLSGRPLTKRATEVIRYIAQKSGKSFPIIGVGGIHSPDDALEKLKAGADLIQLYTGFIYEGPSIIKKINQKFAESGY